MVLVAIPSAEAQLLFFAIEGVVRIFMILFDFLLWMPRTVYRYSVDPVAAKPEIEKLNQELERTPEGPERQVRLHALEVEMDKHLGRESELSKQFLKEFPHTSPVHEHFNNADRGNAQEFVDTYIKKHTQKIAASEKDLSPAEFKKITKEFDQLIEKNPRFAQELPAYFPKDSEIRMHITKKISAPVAPKEVSKGIEQNPAREVEKFKKVTHKALTDAEQAVKIGGKEDAGWVATKLESISGELKSKYIDFKETASTYPKAVEDKMRAMGDEIYSKGHSAITRVKTVVHAVVKEGGEMTDAAIAKGTNTLHEVRASTEKFFTESWHKVKSFSAKEVVSHHAPVKAPAHHNILAK